MDSRWHRSLAIVLLVGIGSSAQADEAPRRNGFRLAPAAVPVEEILAGGPPRDGIPALDAPRHVPASESPWRSDDLVIGVAIDGKARAYPIRVLVWHELVNDQLGGRALLISYCPLCGTGLVFDREIDGRVRRFGVSGLLYRSDLLMFDRGSDSLWSQISSEAVTGPLVGRRLSLVASKMTRWEDWRAAHPDSTVLALPQGTGRDYERSPYPGYAESDQLYFPAPLDRRYHPKMPTLGVRIPGGAARAYPALELVRAGGVAEESFEGRALRVAYDPDRQLFDVRVPEDVEVVEGFWFAWAAFHPSTGVFVAPSDSDGPGPGPP